MVEPTRWVRCGRLANDAHEPNTNVVLIDMAQAWIKLTEGMAR